MKKVSFVLALAMIFALCAAFCGCSGELMKLPMIGEDAQAVTISSGACKMNVNDSISKFAEIFGGLELVEIKPENVFGGVNEKYPSALAEIEGAHHVVVTLADGNETEFYFTDDGSVYYLDGEIVFASDSPIDATAALATAKVGEGLEIWDIINTDKILNTISWRMHASHNPLNRGRDEVDEFLKRMFDGVLFTDNETDVLDMNEDIGENWLLAMGLKGLRIYLYGEFENENIIGGSESLIGVVEIYDDGRAVLQIGDKMYVTADNIFMSAIYDYVF